MESFETKLMAMIVLGLSSMFMGLLPRWFSANGRQHWPLCLSLLICFGGGVLMATSLIHMLPETRQMLRSHQEYAEFILCAGFFLVYIIDEMVHFFYSESHDHTNHNHNHTHHDHNHTHRNHNHTHHNHSHTADATKRRHSTNYQEPPPNYGSTESRPLLYREPSRSFPYNPNYSGVLLMQDQHLYNELPPSQLCHVGHQEPCHVSPISNMGLLLALSVHAVLEGLTVGLQTHKSQVLLLLSAIASHKLVIGFCLGVELASSSLTSACWHFVCIFIFSFGSVVGIGIGMAVHEIPKRLLQIAFPVLQGLAAGTLLYITVSEILPRERARWHKHHHRRVAGILQLVFVIGGFTSMIIVKYFIDTHN